MSVVKLVSVGLAVAFAFVITSIILLIILYKNDTLLWKSNTVKAYVTVESIFVFLMFGMLGVAAGININSENNTKICTEERRQMKVFNENKNK